MPNCAFWSFNPLKAVSNCHLKERTHKVFPNRDQTAAFWTTGTRNCGLPEEKATDSGCRKKVENQEADEDEIAHDLDLELKNKQEAEDQNGKERKNQVGKEGRSKDDFGLESDVSVSGAKRQLLETEKKLLGQLDSLRKSADETGDDDKEGGTARDLLRASGCFLSALLKNGQLHHSRRQDPEKNVLDIVE